MDERAIVAASAGERIALISSSYHRLAGAPLVAAGQALWDVPQAVVAHGTEASPRFFYANRQALALFRMAAAQFIGMESRLSAGETDRAERAAMLGQLDHHNIVTGYRGRRVAGDGTRFVIRDAVIWNLVDDTGQRHGQAAMIPAWSA